MKKSKRLVLFGALFYSLNAISQQTQTPNPSADQTTTLPVPQKGQYAWFRGGNQNAGNAGGSNNIFGTLWNSPIYTQTNGVNRTKLNGTLGIVGAPQYSINGLGFANGVNTSGYFLIGNIGWISFSVFNRDYSPMSFKTSLNLTSCESQICLKSFKDKFAFSCWIKRTVFSSIPHKRANSRFEEYLDLKFKCM